MFFCVSVSGLFQKIRKHPRKQFAKQALEKFKRQVLEFYITCPVLPVGHPMTTAEFSRACRWRIAFMSRQDRKFKRVHSIISTFYIFLKNFLDKVSIFSLYLRIKRKK